MKKGICMRIKCTDCNEMIDIPKENADDFCIYYVLSDDIRKTMIPKIICPDCLAIARKEKLYRELLKQKETMFDFYQIKEQGNTPLSDNEILDIFTAKAINIPISDMSKYFLLHVTDKDNDSMELVSDDGDIISLFRVKDKIKNQKVA